MSPSSALHCTLCGQPEPKILQAYPFYQCETCKLIFKCPSVFLNPAEEKQRYSTHQNSFENLGYLNFLKPIKEQVQKCMPPKSTGLDYGCGPNPVLAQWLQKEGFAMQHYDPHFFPIRILEISDLDFITCTEAAEHFFHPGKEFQTLFSLLKPRGKLFLMTEFAPLNLSPKDWYYTRDPTHVCFYEKETLSFIAEKHGRRVAFENPRTAVFS